MVTIEPTITYGLIAQTVVLGSTLLWFLWGIKNELSIVKTDVRYLQTAQSALTEAFNQLGKLLTQIAVQDTRISMIEKHIDEIKHGKGLVTE
jgi:hypothetical protein